MDEQDWPEPPAVDDAGEVVWTVEALVRLMAAIDALTDDPPPYIPAQTRRT